MRNKLNIDLEVLIKEV